MNNEEIIEKKLKVYNEKLKKKKERWKYIEIKGIKTHYAISNFGRICNCKNGKMRDYKDHTKNTYVNSSLKLIFH